MRNVTAGWGAEVEAEAVALGVALCIVATASPLRRGSAGLGLAQLISAQLGSVWFGSLQLCVRECV